MAKHTVSLSDKFDLKEPRQLLTGTQAIVRLALMQRARDVAAGLNTAGFITGYRGSPIAGLEAAFQRVGKLTDANHIKFQSGLNEDLAATAIWGCQQAELRGEGKYDGVFAIWYGKGPGVDRSGDVFRHANHAGTSKHGGVLALMGDDHTCESSTSAHQSEFAFVDAMIPVLNPAGVQEILDYGLLGLALSRYAGVWVGLKCVKDNIESTATCDGSIDRVKVVTPTDFTMPAGGLSIRLGDQALDKEARLHDYKRDAIQAFVRANKMDQVVLSGGPKPRIGIVTCGKSYLDVRQALDELGIDEVGAAKLGLALYKVAMTYPMEPKGLIAFARDLDLVIVVEEKRALLEVQVREELYGLPHQPVLIGKKDENGQWLFPAKGALDPTDIAIAVGERLIKYGAGDAIKASVAKLKQLEGNAPAAAQDFTRIPYFCAGCPHNSSTVIPAKVGDAKGNVESGRAYAGIGCHYMAQWMDRGTDGFTQMGGEGTNWIGEAPFSTRRHVFQNLGDGTYIHSGSLAVRAAVASGVTMTYKILYNDAVAMTGGQHLDGPPGGQISVPMIASQLAAEGVKKVAVVTDEPEKYGPEAGFPRDVTIYHRRDLQAVQIDLAKLDGVTAVIYDQTCAAEKRRRRKRGEYPNPDKRIFINPAVCEGCGDCGKKSNCVAIIPLETELGRKRAIDQSACNKDFSCTEGFCPSFVTVNGAKVRKSSGAPVSSGAATDGITAMLASLPEPKQPDISGPYSMIVTGVGGTGVVTISAVLGQAAHIEGKGFGAIDMTGLAQKGGAVACHMRVAKDAASIHAIRVGVGNADLIMGGDLVVTASTKILETVRTDHTAMVVSTHEMTTGAFTRNPNLVVPGQKLRNAIADRIGKAPLFAFDAHDYAVTLFGDSIASNMFLLGYSFQKGFVPVGAAAIEQAIELNGAAVEMNRRAFRFGRLAAHDAAALDRIAKPAAAVKLAAKPQTLDDVVAFRAAHLTKYQDADLAARYQAKVKWVADLEAAKAPGKSGLAAAVARSYHKLLAIKDEYEVARLYTDPAFKAALDEQFEATGKLEFHVAPPFLARFHKDKVTGHPRKIKVGAWMLPVFRMMAKAKGLRGTALDVFGMTAERRHERKMIAEYNLLLAEIGERLTTGNHTTAVALASLPEDVKGFGHVKAANHEAAKTREAELLARLRAPTPTPVRQAAE
jgi:indolepyruvate ferredoxin oxidoreductase